MRALALALAALLLAPVDAWANAVQTEAVRGKPSGEVRMGKPKSVVGARYRFEAQVGGYAAMPTGGPVTVTRASTESVVLSDGSTVATVPANALAIGPSGAQVYGPHTKRLVSNQRSSANTANLGISGVGSPWTIRGTATCTLSPDPAPDGSYTAERCTVAAQTTADVYLVASGFTVSTTLSTSTWIKPVSVSGSVRFINPAGVGNWLLNISTFGSGSWKRAHSGVVGLTVNAAFQSSAGGAAGMQFYSNDGSSLTFDIWRPDQVEGSIVYPSAEVGALPLSVPGTAVSGASGLSGSRACIRSRATRAWSGSGTLASVGSVGAANSAALYLSAGAATCAFWDASATLSYRIFSPSLTGSDEKELACCAEPGSFPVLTVDGVVATGSTSAAVVGTVDFSGKSLVVGGRAAAGNEFNGTIRSIVTCNTSIPESCR